jgi:hypothetical protein
MKKNQNFGLPIIEDDITINKLKNSFNNFSKWALVGEGTQGTAFYISHSKLQSMLDENPDSEGFKINLGMVESPEDPNEPTTNRVIELIVSSIIFDKEIEVDDTSVEYTIQNIYSSLPNLVTEPPVLKCPPMDPIPQPADE